MKVKPRAALVVAPAEAPAATKTAPRTPRGELRREGILKAAREVFMEHGYAGTSIEEVVRRVGGSKASLYSYFGSKEGLFGDIIAMQCNEFMSTLVIPTGPDQDIAGTLGELARRFLKVFLQPERRSLFRIIIAEAPRFPELAKRFYENGPLRARRLLGAYLRAQHEAGLLHCPDADTAASLYIEMVKAMPHHRMLLGLPSFHTGHDIESHTRAVIELFLNGCAPRAASRSGSKP